MLAASTCASQNMRSDANRADRLAPAFLGCYSHGVSLLARGWSAGWMKRVMRAVLSRVLLGGALQQLGRSECAISLPR